MKTLFALFAAVAITASASAAFAANRITVPNAGYGYMFPRVIKVEGNPCLVLQNGSDKCWAPHGMGMATMPSSRPAR